MSLRRGSGAPQASPEVSVLIVERRVEALLLHLDEQLLGARLKLGHRVVRLQRGGGAGGLQRGAAAAAEAACPGAPAARATRGWAPPSAPSTRTCGRPCSGRLQQPGGVERRRGAWHQRQQQVRRGAARARTNEGRAALAQHVERLDGLPLEAVHDVDDEHGDVLQQRHGGVESARGGGERRQRRTQSDEPRERKFVNCSWPGVSMMRRPGTLYSRRSDWFCRSRSRGQGVGGGSQEVRRSFLPPCVPSCRSRPGGARWGSTSRRSAA